MPKISVVIPTFNRAALLAEAIHSVLAQGFRDYELLVLDDASEDDTAAAVAQFPDSRIRYLRNPRNLGFVGNWNRGLALARGDYVMFPGDDDRLLPGCLATLAAVLDGDDELALASANADEIDLAGSSLTERIVPLAEDLRLAPGEFARIFAAHALCNERGYYFFLPFPSTLYRKRLLDASRFRFREEAGGGADQLAAVELNLRHPLHFTGRPLLSWRRHRDQLSGPDRLGGPRYALTHLRCAEALLEAGGLADFLVPLRAQITMIEARLELERRAWDVGDGGGSYRDWLGERFATLAEGSMPPLPRNRESALFALLNAVHGFREAIGLAEGGAPTPEPLDRARSAREGVLLGELEQWLRLLGAGGGIGRRLRRRGVGRVALLGAGLLGYLLAEDFLSRGGPEVVAFADNESSRTGRLFRGRPVVAPAALSDRCGSVDAVIVAIGRGDDREAARVLSEVGGLGTDTILTWAELLEAPLSVALPP